MDGSEVENMFQETEEKSIVYTIGQPQVIVERVIPEDVIEEDDGQPQNGEATDKTTLDDIIADAVGGPEADDSTNAIEEDASQAAEGEEEESQKDEAAGDTESTPAIKKEPEALDLNQCRCCTAREDLQDIFEPLKRDLSLPISTAITKLCTKLTITKRDHLPNVICKTCVYKLEIAWEFRTQCEKTDEDLRKSLPRAKKVSRKRTDYTLIDYDSSSGEDAGGNVDDEEEFKLSDEMEEDSVASDSEVDSDAPTTRKRGRPKKGKKPATPKPVKHVTGTPTPGTPSSRGRGRPPRTPVAITPRAALAKANSAAAAKPRIAYVEPKSDSDEDSDDKDSDEAPLAKKAIKQCPKCKAVVKGPHTCKVIAYSCNFCTEKFITHPLYMNHQQLHTNFMNVNTCVRCHRQFANKPELRKHQSAVRCHKAMKNNCLNCNRALANASQLAIHLRTKCQPSTGSTASPKGVPMKKQVVSLSTKSPAVVKKEKAPFKFEAPKNSTYWSDSFSD